jgi:glycopeptide antibiotics resistance protein
VKTLSKAVLTLYFLTLLWLLLFKFSFDLLGVLLDHQARSFNLIPFAGYSQDNLREMIDNFIVFIPFGLLLGVIPKQTGLLRKLAFIAVFSLAVEIIQFVFAIGVTDITDVAANILGGLFGLAIYGLSAKYLDNKKLNWFILITGAILLVALIMWRVLFLRVRY